MAFLTKVGGMTFGRMWCTFFIMIGGKKKILGARNRFVGKKWEGEGEK